MGNYTLNRRIQQRYKSLDPSQIRLPYLQQPAPKHSHILYLACATQSSPAIKQPDPGSTKLSNTKSITVHNHTAATMPQHRHNGSVSSSEGERQYYNPRRDNRATKETRTPSSRPTKEVVISYGRPTYDEPRRSHEQIGSKWQ